MRQVAETFTTFGEGSNFVLTTLLSVRYKERRNKNLTDSLLGRKDACSKYNYEVTCNL